IAITSTHCVGTRVGTRAATARAVEGRSGSSLPLDLLLLPREARPLTMSQRRAVIICFDDRLRGSLRQHLAGLGFVTWNEVRDGRAALAQIRRAHPQLVVLAPPLPSLDAAQLTETMIRGEIAPLVLVLPEGAELGEESVREVALCARL